MSAEENAQWLRFEREMFAVMKAANGAEASAEMGGRRQA